MSLSSEQLHFKNKSGAQVDIPLYTTKAEALSLDSGDGTALTVRGKSGILYAPTTSNPSYPDAAALVLYDGAGQARYVHKSIGTLTAVIYETYFQSKDSFSLHFPWGGYIAAAASNGSPGNPANSATGGAGGASGVGWTVHVDGAVAAYVCGGGGGGGAGRRGIGRNAINTSSPYVYTDGLDGAPGAGGFGSYKVIDIAAGTHSIAFYAAQYGGGAANGKNGGAGAAAAPWISSGGYHAGGAGTAGSAGTAVYQQTLYDPGGAGGAGGAGVPEANTWSAATAFIQIYRYFYR